MARCPLQKNLDLKLNSMQCELDKINRYEERHLIFVIKIRFCWIRTCFDF